jgi:hypothetical protein
MPSKPPPKPQAPTFSDPLTDLLVAPTAATVPTEEPGGLPPGAPPDDEEEEDEAEDPDRRAVPAPPRPAVSRRGFFGAAAGVVAGAVAASALPPAAQAEPVLDAAPSLGAGMTSEMAAFSQFFSQLMEERDARQQADLDRRFAEIRAELPVSNGVAHTSSPAELAARPGQYPPSAIFKPPGIERAGGPMEAPSTGYPGPWGQAQGQAQTQSQQRMVAFIPKEDPYNPRQTTFRGWVNGRELRAKRGQIMIVSLGTGVDWARNGHGNCVDVAAMQGVGTVEPMAVPQMPDYSRPPTWDGLPTTNRSSIPVGAF